jgi:hypothetical protein
VKSVKKHRPLIPRDVIALKDMYEHVLANLDPVRQSDTYCEVCREHDRLVGVDGLDGDVFTCALCLVTYHNRCCQDVVLKGRSLPNVEWPSQQLPASFLSERVLCSLCQELVKLVHSP